jgi:pyruvate-ferredoxin/flavodoxin oxidoreductase
MLCWLRKLFGGEPPKDEPLGAPKPGENVPLQEPAAEEPKVDSQAKAHVEETPVELPEYVAPVLETKECTGCSECVLINDEAFQWNDDRQAELVNPDAATYAELVKAAERCAARCIKPGTPKDANEPGLAKLMKRAERFNQS